MADNATKDDIERLVNLMQEGFARIDQRFDEVNARLDTQALRSDRHDALLKTGSRWTGKMNEWAEKVDSALDEKDKQIAELSERIWKLEKDRA
jgi:hypothetical protein